MNDTKIVATQLSNTADLLSSSSPNLIHQKLNRMHHPHVRWHADVLVDGHKALKGVVKDISTKGVNLLLDHNLQNSKHIKLHIQIPHHLVSNDHHILEVSGIISFSIYDSAEDSFRSIISPLEFPKNLDVAYLQTHVAGFNGQ
jgi:hypothetical protein